MPADAIVGGTFTSVHNPMTTTVTQFLGVNNTGVAAGHWTKMPQEISIPSLFPVAHSPE